MEQTKRRECSQDEDGKLDSTSKRPQHETDAEALKLENAQLQVTPHEVCSKIVLYLAKNALGGCLILP